MSASNYDPLDVHLPNYFWHFILCIHVIMLIHCYFFFNYLEGSNTTLWKVSDSSRIAQPTDHCVLHKEPHTTQYAIAPISLAEMLTKAELIKMLRWLYQVFFFSFFFFCCTWIFALRFDTLNIFGKIIIGNTIFIKLFLLLNFRQIAWMPLVKVTIKMIYIFMQIYK